MQFTNCSLKLDFLMPR